MDNIDKIRNASIIAQVILKEASTLVIAGKYTTPKEASLALLETFDEIFDTLMGNKQVIDEISSPKPLVVKKLTPIKKENLSPGYIVKPVKDIELEKVETLTTPEVDVIIERSALFMKGITALEQCANQFQAEELINKFRVGTKLSSQEKSELLDIALDIKNKLPF